MQYLCLIYDDEKAWEKLPPAESAKVIGEFKDYTEAIRKGGHYVGGNALAPTHTATTVRVRQGKVATTDGPFAETKEQLGGYYLLNARDLERGDPARGPHSRRALRQRRSAAGDGDAVMRYMIIVKATKDSEAGVLPPEHLLAEMCAYHGELAKAGVLVDGSGLQATSKGWRVRYRGAGRTVIDGPFAETKELIAGYTIINVKSRAEALEWTKKVPEPDARRLRLRDRSAADVRAQGFRRKRDTRPLREIGLGGGEEKRP